MVLNKGEVWKNRNDIYPKDFVKIGLCKKRSGGEHREAAPVRPQC